GGEDERAGGGGGGDAGEAIADRERDRDAAVGPAGGIGGRGGSTEADGRRGLVDLHGEGLVRLHIAGIVDGMEADRGGAFVRDHEGGGAARHRGASDRVIAGGGVDDLFGAGAAGVGGGEDHVHRLVRPHPRRVAAVVGRSGRCRRGSVRYLLDIEVVV